MTTTDPIITNLVTAAMTYAEKAQKYEDAWARRYDAPGADLACLACTEADQALADAEGDLREAARLCTAEAVRDGLVSK